MNYAETDSHAEQAQAEIRAKAQQAKDAIAVKVGWMIRSNGQRRRWDRAKKGACNGTHGRTGV